MKMTARMLLVCALFGSSSAAAFQQPAAPPPGEAAPSLDDELLRDLEADLDEDALRGSPKRSRPLGAADPGKQPRHGDAMPDELDEDQLDKELLRALGHDVDENERNPIGAIGRNMRRVEELVAQAKSGKPTQELQDKIVADLDELLKAARQRQQQQRQQNASKNQQSSRQSASRQQGSGSAGGESDQPAADSGAALRDRAASRPDPGEMKDLLRELWGHLPEHERQMVINSTIEQFLPKYELLIEAYFKRLAEESAAK